MPHETVSVTQSVNSVSITDVNAGVDSFGQLSDTVFTSVGDNELLQYDSATSKWINQTITEAGILGDTVLTSLGDNELLQYDTSSSKWINQTITEAGIAALAGATFTGSITHQGLGSLTSGTTIDQMVTSVVAMQLTTSYQDTNITQSSALPTGTYAMLVHVNDVAGGGLAEAYYSATVSIYGGTTSTDDFASEIPLHRSGGSENNKHIFLRTRSEADTNNVRLEMKADSARSQSSNYTFKFRRLI